MGFLGSKPKQALGLMVDGLEVKVAHLSREKDKMVLRGLASATLESRFDSGEAVEGPSEPSELVEDELLGLETLEELEGQVAREEEEESNSSILFKLLSKFPVVESDLALSLIESRVFFSEFQDNFGLKGRKLKRRLQEEVQAEGGVDSLEDDKHNYFESGRGPVVSVRHDDRLDILSILDELGPFLGGKVRVSLIDANEVALMNLARLIHSPEERVVAVVYIGVDFSRVIFMQDGDYLSLSQVINEGFQAPQILNTVFSRIIFEQDTFGIPEIDRILLAGEGKFIEAKEFLASQFPKAKVDYLVPEPLDISQIDEAQTDQISAFSIPIALAWKALDPKNTRFYPTNLLPSERRRLQKPFVIEWHGLVLITLIALTALLLGVRAQEQNRAIDSLKFSVQLKEEQIKEANTVVELINSLDVRIKQYERNLALVDSLSEGSDKWSSILRRVADGSRKTNSIWFRSLAGGEDGITLKGRSIYRNRVPKIDRFLGGAGVRKISRAEIRGRGIYDFELGARFSELRMQDRGKKPASSGVEDMSSMAR